MRFRLRGVTDVSEQQVDRVIKAAGTNDGGPSQPARKGRYLPGVDGLRALAVLAVVAYHMNLPWAQGGLVGVTVFFVISGYLITGILISELERTRTVDIKRFWVRRIRRLLPAVVLVVAVSATLMLFFNSSLLYKLRTDLASALLFFTNWWYIFRQQSYFEAVSSPSPLLHFWSLSIEEQFYLVWPLVMLLLFKLRIGKPRSRQITLGLAVLSCVLMAVLYDPAGDPSRVYYGTDTRSFSLLFGAYLAFVWPAYKTGKPVTPVQGLAAHHDGLFQAAAIVSLLALAAMTIFIPGTSPLFYWGGLALASILSAVLIAAISWEHTLVSRVFSTTPFTWMGTRSYGIYLWHYPLLLLMNPQNADAPGPVKIILELALVLLVSELSYRFVENPFRHGLIGKALKAAKDNPAQVGTALRRRAVPVAASVALLALSTFAVATAQEPAGMGLLTEEDLASGVQPEQSGTSGEDTAQDVANPSDETTAGYEPLMIGDSVSVSLIDAFHEAYPGGLLDACGNRQIAMGQKVYDYYKDRGEVGKNVIIALGTNGQLSDEAVESLLSDIGGDKTVWFVTNRVPASWHSVSNEVIARAAANHENVRVIDWAAYSEGHPEWLSSGDGVHLSGAGRDAFMQMIVEAIGDNEDIAAATEAANEKNGGAWTAPEDGSLSADLKAGLQAGLTAAARESATVTGEQPPA